MKTYGQFKRWYEDVTCVDPEKVTDHQSDDDSPDYKYLFLLYLKMLLLMPVTAVYIALRIVESVYEALVQQKWRKGLYIFAGAGVGAAIPALFAVGIGYAIANLPLEHAIAAVVISGLLFAPFAFAAVAEGIMYGKNKARDHNFTRYGSTNPQKHGYEQDLTVTPVASEKTPLSIVSQDQDSDAGFKKLAERTRSLLKLEREGGAFQPSRGYASVQMIDEAPAIIAKVKNGSANVGDKTKLTTWYDILYDRCAKSEKYPDFPAEVINTEALRNSLGQGVN